eukprot:836036-Prymnesium_polylepis.2
MEEVEFKLLVVKQGKCRDFVAAGAELAPWERTLAELPIIQKLTCDPAHCERTPPTRDVCGPLRTYTDSPAHPLQTTPRSRTLSRRSPADTACDTAHPIVTHRRAPRTHAPQGLASPTRLAPTRSGRTTRASTADLTCICAKATGTTSAIRGRRGTRRSSATAGARYNQAPSIPPSS